MKTINKQNFKDYLDKISKSYKIKNNNLTVGGFLDLEDTQITELPDNLTVGGSLDLRGTQITELPDNLTVGGHLYLRGTQITELPDNLTVGGSLYLRGTQITELPDNLTVGGFLYLEDTQITELPDNLTVGGSLDLRGTQITELPDNLTVGGFLDLEDTQITELPDNLTVGGHLYLRGTQITELPDKYENQDVSFLSWKNEKYIKVDDIFCEVIKKRGKVWKCKKLHKKEHFYIVTDGKGKYAHGNTVKEAKEDLIYKISNRSKEDFAHLKLNSVLTFQEMIECYRVITGACAFGVKDFIQSNKIKQRDYTIKEVITLTKESYGGTSFANFFKC